MFLDQKWFEGSVLVDQRLGTCNCLGYAKGVLLLQAKMYLLDRQQMFGYIQFSMFSMDQLLSP